MKKIGMKIVSIILAMSLLIGGTSAMGTASAADIGKTFERAGLTIVEVIFTTLVGGLNLIVPDSKEFVQVKDRVIENFYEGTEKWNKEAKADAQWKLGHAKASLIPDDLKEAVANGTKSGYYLGGFIDPNNGMVNEIEEIIDDMQIRVIAVEDGSGRGVALFANIDCIGFSNGDIKEIRKRVEAMDLGVEFNSINVSSTHTHSCIDTQGLWTNLFAKLFKNLALSYIPFVDKERGANAEYMEFVYKTAAETMKNAVNDMRPGTMTYAVKEIGDEENSYFNNKNRSQSTSLMKDLSRFIFTPDDGTKPTMIVNIAAHPDVAGLPVNDEDNGRDLSGDYIYYLGEKIEEKGYNFMFFNGAIAGIYEGRGPASDGVPTERRYEETLRYGHEIANMALNLTNSVEEIEANMTDAEKAKMEEEKAIGGDNYTLWYKDWKPVKETVLEPNLNIIIKEVKIKVTNPLIQLVGKLNLVNYTVCKEGFNYYIFAEIGYMEMGDVKVAFMPGEIVQDLICGGGSLTADGSFTGKEFEEKTIYQLFGEDTICFGLMNDAIGYVVPDNDYSMSLLGDHYQEMISLGKYAGSSIMKGFAKIAREIKYK
ncbi:MAG: hypothetical protein IJO03_11930 [Clostridia bacterium]|nr:hypothetical protein [Clostridia bacterium]MBQ7122960.1 hypothetical protein [Clostridia bacterium]